MKSIAVYCGASPGNNPLYKKAAEELGLLMAKKGITLVYGGGSVGLMGTIAESVLSGGGNAIGVITEDLVNREVADTNLPDLRIVKTMLERKELIAELSEGFIAMPGGYGTMDEIFEVLTATQLGYHPHPCGFLNTAGYYDHLLAFLDRSVEDGFLHEIPRSLALSAPTPESLLEMMENHTPPKLFDKTKLARKKSGL